MRYNNLVCLSVLFLGLIHWTLTAQLTLTPETLHKIPRISGPKLSPDGNRILYARTDMNQDANSGTTFVKILDEKLQTVMEIREQGGSVSAATWVGQDKVWYLTTVEGRSHIVEMSLSGERKVITQGDFDVKYFGTDEKGERIWIVRDVAFTNPADAFKADLSKVNGVRIYDGLMYRHWMSWYDYKHQHIFIGEYSNGSVTSWKDIMEGEPYDAPLKPFGSGGQIALDPQGRFLAYTCKKESGTASAISTNSGIYLYEFESGQTHLLTAQNKGYDTYPSFSPDGKWIAWLSMQTPGYEADKNRLMVADISGNGSLATIVARAQDRTLELTKGFDSGADAFKWDPKLGSTKIYFNAGVDGTHNIHQVEWSSNATMQLRALTGDRADYQDFSIAYQGNTLRMVASRMAIDAPTEIYEIQVADGKVTRITQETMQALSGVRMGKVEARMVATFDGKKMLTWVIYPPDFDPNKQYPTLLYCQGGPQSTVSQFFSYRWNFQLMAAQGYIIVAPNRRGLPSFGTSWNEQISGDWGGAAMKDLLSAIDDVSKEPYVAKDKRGAVGASFGGYSVYWLAGNHEGRFKAFISHCGVFNLESMYGTTEEMFFVHHDLGGAYWDVPVPVSYLMHSPHKYVHKWDTPMLVIHNERDYRVPLGQGMEAFTAAQLRGVPSRFLYFEDEGHWVNKVQNSIVWNRVFFDWLDTYLK